MMTALTMVGVFQRSRAYSISHFQDPLSPNKVIPLTVCIAEWNVCMHVALWKRNGNVSALNKAPLYYLANFT